MFRVNNCKVAKGAMYSLKALAWGSYLPYYRQSILRSGLVEEVQVSGCLLTLNLASSSVRMIYFYSSFQAPADLRKFIEEHKFGQRNHANGDLQEVDYTHQVHQRPS